MAAERTLCTHDAGSGTARQSQPGRGATGRERYRFKLRAPVGSATSDRLDGYGPGDPGPCSASSPHSLTGHRRLHAAPAFPQRAPHSISSQCRGRAPGPVASGSAADGLQDGLCASAASEEGSEAARRFEVADCRRLTSVDLRLGCIGIVESKAASKRRDDRDGRRGDPHYDRTTSTTTTTCNTASHTAQAGRNDSPEHNPFTAILHPPPVHSPFPSKATPPGSASQESQSAVLVAGIDATLRLRFRSTMEPIHAVVHPQLDTHYRCFSLVPPVRTT